MTPLFRKFLGLNWILLLTMLGLTVVGIHAVYSATFFRTDVPEIAVSWRKQIQWSAIGLVVFFGAALVDYKWIRWGALPAFLVAVGGLLMVELKGEVINNHKSWVRVPGLGLVQPSQFAIGTGIILLSFVLGELHRLHRIFRYHFVRLLLAGLVMAIPLGFVLKQGDLGSGLVWFPVLGGMVLVGSIPFRYLIAGSLLGLMVAPILFFFFLKPYQQDRILVPLRIMRGEAVDYQREGYATTNVINAIGSAGWEGKGFAGERMQIDPATGKRRKTMHQLGYIPKPEAHTDYIFPVFAEQHGFRGSLLLLCGFVLMVFQCLFIAVCARDQVGRLLVIGVAALIFAHVFQNVGMQVQLMPITGIPLPFISYGGSFLVTLMLLMGLVQSVWVHRNVALQEEKPARKKETDALSSPRTVLPEAAGA